MHKLLIATLLCFIAAVSFAQIISDVDATTLFERFMVEHKRDYSNDAQVYKKKFEIFKQNLNHVLELNARNGKQVQFAVTKFMDMTKEEFANTMLMRTPIQRPETGANSEYQLVTEYPSNDLPENFSWVEKGAVTPVKDQGHCGSCWAFSSIGNLEGQWFLANGSLVSLSEQQLVDCDHECMDPKDKKTCDDGCKGGIMLNAFEFVIKNKGIASAKDYPYTHVVGKCNTKVNATAKIDGKKLLSSDENEIQQHLYANGPVSVAIDAEELQFYFGGIFSDPSCSHTHLTHAVLLVGWGVENGTPYWLLKNSWGTLWGERGFFRLARNQDQCGITRVACTAVIKK